MATTISFLKFGKGEFFTGKLENIKDRYSQDEVSSTYNQRKTNAGNAISYNLWEAVLCYIGKGRPCFVGKTSNGHVAELLSKDGKTRQIVHLIKRKNHMYTVQAATCDTPADSPTLVGNYTIGSTGLPGFSGTAVLLALLPDIIEDSEGGTAFSTLKAFAEHPEDDVFWDDETNLEQFGLTLALFTDNVYRRMTNPNVPASVALELPKNNKDIQRLHMDVLRRPVTILAGKPFYFQARDMKQVLSSLRLDNIKYTAAEKKSVPVMKDTFHWAEWIIKSAQYIKMSSKYDEPIRTCYFIGPSGCGKSIGSVGLASALGLVYDHITCQSDMELFDFLGQIFPNTNPAEKMDFEDVRKQMGLPSVEDIVMDKEGSYIRMYKKECPESISEEDLICSMVNRVNKRISELCSSKDYTYVEGGLVKALRYGYAFEIQEIGIVKRAGVAVGLNALLEVGKNAFLTLPTGEVIKKHPNCCIFFTSNDEYEGTCNLNQSVLSRMGHVVWFKNASAEQMAKRAKGVVTDFYDDTVLLKMAMVVEDINSFMATHGITDGVCGQRELNNWAIEVMIEMELQGADEASDEILRMTCQTAVLGKVSQNEEDIQSVAEGCVDSIWMPWDVRI